MPGMFAEKVLVTVKATTAQCLFLPAAAVLQSVRHGALVSHWLGLQVIITMHVWCICCFNSSGQPANLPQQLH